LINSHLQRIFCEWLFCLLYNSGLLLDLS
jgi:hypothetical protein